MIAVVVSLFFALYVLGPDAFSRFLLGFTVPRRFVILTKSEEVARALIWSGVSFLLAYGWLHVAGVWTSVWQPPALKVFFAGVYSEPFFNSNKELWFRSLHAVFILNLSLLSRVYVIVLLLSVLLSLLTHYYGWIRSLLPEWTFLREAFAAMVLPRVDRWHVLLSKLLLADRSLSIHLDILTKSDKLYQGEFADKAMAADGSLVNVTLASPRRFDREGWMASKGQTSRRVEDFWKPIPTNMFIVMGSEIHTMNIRYLPQNRSVRSLKPGSPELIELLQTIAEQVQAIREQSRVEAKRPAS